MFTLQEIFLKFKHLFNQNILTLADLFLCTDLNYVAASKLSKYSLSSIRLSLKVRADVAYRIQSIHRPYRKGVIYFSLQPGFSQRNCFFLNSLTKNT